MASGRQFTNGRKKGASSPKRDVAPGTVGLKHCRTQKDKFGETVVTNKSAARRVRNLIREFYK